MTDRIRVAVVGALGRMGRETVRAVVADEGLELIGAADVAAARRPAGEARMSGSDIPISASVAEMLAGQRPDVVVDFTTPAAVFANACEALAHGVTTIIGTTGLDAAQIEELGRRAAEKEVGVAVIPNFAIGAVLMMRFAAEAARYLPHAEIIELHHDQKLDAPSGTALKTAELVNAAMGEPVSTGVAETEKLAGARGGKLERVRIHSVRLPGLVAHQEVIFGGVGQCLTIRHDSFNRESFMPGVLLAIKRMVGRRGLVYGLENLL